MQFCLDHTKSPTLKWHHGFLRKNEFTEHWTLPVGRVWNDSHFMYSQIYIHTNTRWNTNLASIQRRSYYLLKCQELNKMKSSTWYQLHGQSFFYFWEWVPLVKLHSHLFWSSMNIPFLQHIRKGHTTFSKSYCHHFKVPVAFPPTLNQNLMQAHCSWNSAVF
jgi:hypothetical protein